TPLNASPKTAYKTVPNVIGLSLASAQTRLRDDSLRVESIGSASQPVADQWPRAGLSVPSGSEVALATDGSKLSSEATVPNLRGMNMTQALSVLAASGLRLQANGFGVAVSQSAAPGTLRALGSEISVQFTTPATKR
ncbi:MAG: PASTA domain-containing protein, partial [Firmicutes bacterium]|nr:PASTA domain-containing protein [Bacillota bacterium]